MPERRRYTRTKVFKNAKLILGNHATVSCVVRDLSNHGACLHLPKAAKLPSAFDLSFDTGRTLRRSRIAWQSLFRVGVSFEQPAAHRRARADSFLSAQGAL